MKRRRAGKGWAIGGVLALAVLALAGEIAWYSAPVQEWRLARLDTAALEQRTATEPYNTRVLYYYALRLQAGGRWKEAADVLHRAVVMEPGSPRLLAAMGTALLRLRREARAEEYLREAVRRGDRTPETTAALARIDWARGHFQEAAREWRVVLRARPRDAAAWYGLGLCEAQMMRPEEWREAMASAARLQPGVPEYQRGLGEAFAYQEAWVPAERAFRAALRLQPNDAAGRYQLATVLGRQATTPAQVAAAEAEFRRAAAALPRDPELRLAFGRFYAARGRWSDAVREFEALVHLDPQHEQGRYHLATAYRHLGRAADAARALAAFQRISDAKRTARYLTARLTLDPNNADLRRRLARVQETLNENNHQDTKDTKKAAE
jgi:tetratricopeptide (TPR) repeat protein